MEQYTESSDISAIVRDQAQRLFSDHISPQVIAEAEKVGWAENLWRALEAAGLPGALVDFGLEARDAFGLIRLAGYHSAPVPLAEMMVAAGIWARCGGTFQEGTITLAAGPGSTPLRAVRAADGWMLSGHLPGVPWGSRADYVLADARGDNGESWVVLLPNSCPATRGVNLALEPRDDLRLPGVAVGSNCVRAQLPDLSVLSAGALLRSCQMVGAMERALDYAIAYAAERQQFGRQIGKFQAIQQMLADAFGEFAAAAAAVDGAVDTWSGGQFELSCAVAKARAGEAAGKVAAVCHQVFGAMGFTQEHPLHYSTRRLWSWRDEFGSDAYWESIIGRQIAKLGGDATWDLLVRIAHPDDEISEPVQNPNNEAEFHERAT